MVEVIGIGDIDFDKVAKRIAKGEVFIYPTDTIYGIGCDATNVESITRIFDIKQRQRGKPFSVAFSDMQMLLRYVDVDEGQKEAMAEKLPGAYTFIVNKKGIPDAATAGLPTVGVRIPDFGPLKRLIAKAKVPIVTTSANTSGEHPASTIQEISHQLLNSVDFAIDAGRCGSGVASTVIDLATGKKIR